MTLTMSSLPEGYRAVIVGARGGIGEAMARHIASDARCGALFVTGRSGAEIPQAASLTLDLEDEASIKAALETAGKDGPLHLVIVASGILHDEGLSPEKTWRHLEAASMARAYAINTIGPSLVAKHALPKLDRSSKSVFAALSARVGSISDNRLGGWHAYRASKAALNQVIKTCSIELARKNRSALCIGLHPGTVDTALSEPFQGNVPDGKLFTPEYSASKLLGVINTLDEECTGQCFDWAGEQIAP